MHIYIHYNLRRYFNMNNFYEARNITLENKELYAKCDKGLSELKYDTREHVKAVLRRMGLLYYERRDFSKPVDDQKMDRTLEYIPKRLKLDVMVALNKLVPIYQEIKKVETENWEKPKEPTWWSKLVDHLCGRSRTTYMRYP